MPQMLQRNSRETTGGHEHEILQFLRTSQAMWVHPTHFLGCGYFARFLAIQCFDLHLCCHTPALHFAMLLHAIPDTLCLKKHTTAPKHANESSQKPAEFPELQFKGIHGPRSSHCMEIHHIEFIETVSGLLNTGPWRNGYTSDISVLMKVHSGLKVSRGLHACTAATPLSSSLQLKAWIWWNCFSTTVHKLPIPAVQWSLRRQHTLLTSNISSNATQLAKEPGWIKWMTSQGATKHIKTPQKFGSLKIKISAHMTLFLCCFKVSLLKSTPKY